MQSNRNWIKGALALLLLAAATGAMAGTTGTEFQNLYTWLTGLVQGYFGKAAAVAAIGLGALFSLKARKPVCRPGSRWRRPASGILTATV